MPQANPLSDLRAHSTHPNLIFGICCMSLLIVGMDVTIVNGGSQPLEGTEGDRLTDGVRQTAESGTGDEEKKTDLKDAPAAETV